MTVGGNVRGAEGPVVLTEADVEYIVSLFLSFESMR